MHALEQFNLWLPAELRYSVLKAPYHLKLPRTALGQEPTSTYGFLGTEWEHAKLMRNAGAHHPRAHQKTAQLQLAKFAAGIYDKMGMIEWLKVGNQPEHIDQQLIFSEIAASRAILTNPFHLTPDDFDPATELKKGFEDTFFARGILRFQEDIQTTCINDKDRLEEVRREVHILGAVATVTYLHYAENFLSPEQYFLAPSELQKTT